MFQPRRCNGGPSNRGADRRVQGGLRPVRQGRGRHHQHQGARHGHELPRPEAHTSGQHVSTTGDSEYY